MSEQNEELSKEAEKSLPYGLGSNDTQPGIGAAHAATPDSTVYGLGSADTQAEAGEPGHVAIDHTEDALDSGMPVGLGADDTQSGPATPHHTDSDSTKRGMGSADTQHRQV